MMNVLAILYYYFMNIFVHCFGQPMLHLPVDMLSINNLYQEAPILCTPQENYFCSEHINTR